MELISIHHFAPIQLTARYYVECVNHVRLLASRNLFDFLRVISNTMTL